LAFVQLLGLCFRCETLGSGLYPFWIHTDVELIVRAPLCFPEPPEKFAPCCGPLDNTVVANGWAPLVRSAVSVQYHSFTLRLCCVRGLGAFIVANVILMWTDFDGATPPPTPSNLSHTITRIAIGFIVTLGGIFAVLTRSIWRGYMTASHDDPQPPLPLTAL
jgi:hypothetical protein